MSILHQLGLVLEELEMPRCGRRLDRGSESYIKTAGFERSDNLGSPNELGGMTLFERDVGLSH